MKTAMINDKRQELTYRTSTDMYTRLTNPYTGKASQFGADAYTAEDEKHIVLVATSGNNGGDISQSMTVITLPQWEELLGYHDVYNGSPFHFAVMSVLGFE